MCEVFNSFILEARDKPILTLVAMVKDLIMVRIQVNRDKADKWKGKLCPKPRLKLTQNVKDASACMPTKSDRAHFQVYTGSTTNQCAVDLEKRKCTCRKWQLSGIPCKHTCASIRLNREDVDDYVDECYYIDTYKKVYQHAIVPIYGPDFWPQTRRVGPLLLKTRRLEGLQGLGGSIQLKLQKMKKTANAKLENIYVQYARNKVITTGPARY
ncbi:hypothetical protein LIER_37349 [Lithospermum erythrorhizon]|uniref:SWIM-type domain-containing protein n=1 Tax=Lithospermum erythrorhizon TaxID=34254 RepID=A0AAV3PKY7_LITER